jgi:glycosidase
MPTNQPLFEFHVSRWARDRYQFDLSLYSFTGNVIFANFHAARLFAQKMNEKRDLLNHPDQAVRAGQINAMGLIDEILHLVVANYRKQVNPGIMRGALDWLEEKLGQSVVEHALVRFCEQFPPLAIYRKETSVADYLSGSSEGFSHRELALEEMLMLWIANGNPAFTPYNELFDDLALQKETVYASMMSGLYEYFGAQAPFGPEKQNLIDMLRAPARTHPDSLTAQLEFIRTRWGGLLGNFLYRLLSSLDLVKEEEKAIFFGPGPAQVLEFQALEHEPEAFSLDRDWMPRLVLIAKNAFVWLDQLSKKYRQPISHLDQIPDQELERLAKQGITGLWLIGLWERSAASQRIKQLRGNPDAVASAYSLFGYEIAKDLGGEPAYQALRDRAWRYGIRLASDMVPNHMGIDSRWVIEHPDWFIQLNYSPFPSYTFNGPNLSWDARVGLFIEDHYYDSSDAAVVFKRVDYWTGDTRYIYNGNDCTSMPWNGTAQLDYLKSEVREAVIQTILEVARKFPIIRFDAAMTLAKKHYQRLWYPEPGSGGDIPSRAEHGMTREQFDQAMPVEFWREVVDRVAAEVPDTLLLAEAFWLMEGYFVRTLGMHRVYNSAFMNMLRDEKNQEYRLVIKNTLEFDPEILKRYVNFMNNPDERTAVDQFGKGDKYFGVCTLMATLPGLPMLGHGQIEGFTEKYGMEYRRAYWDEQPDPYLIDRHEREIFPLLRRRYLFAEAHNFRLYDFYTPEGYVNEDVYAYSNRAGEERALVVYHNKFANTRGWIRTSAAFPIKHGEGERELVQVSLADGLALPHDPGVYITFRDHITGLEYLRNAQELSEQGLYLELEAYSYHVFWDFKVIPDNAWRQYAQLAGYLNGRGVPSIDEALKEIFLQSIHDPYREMVNSGQISWLIDHRMATDQPAPDLEALLGEIQEKALRLMQSVETYLGTSGNAESYAQRTRQQVERLLELPALAEMVPLPRSRKYRQALKFLQAGPQGSAGLAAPEAKIWGPLFAWCFTHDLAEAAPPQVLSGSTAQEVSRTWLDEWLLGKMIAACLQDLGLAEVQSWRGVSAVRLMISHAAWFERLGKTKLPAYQTLQAWLKDQDVQRFIGANRFQDVLWFNREAFDEFLWWMFAGSVAWLLFGVEKPAENPQATAVAILARWDVIDRLRKAAAGSGYQLERLASLIKG